MTTPAVEPTPPPKKIPPFRIEVRSPDYPAAWFIIEFAHTPEQRDNMLKRRGAEYGEAHTRALPNASQVDVDLLLQYLAQTAVAPLVAAGEFIVQQKLEAKFADDKGLNVEQIAAPAQIRDGVLLLLAGSLPPGFPPAPPPVSVPAAAAAEMQGEKVPAAALADAAPELPAVPLPFDVGAVLEDTNSETRVRVTKIHREDGTGRAFDWENLDPESPDKIGTCPLESAVYFRVDSDDSDAKPKKAKKQRKED